MRKVLWSCLGAVMLFAATAGEVAAMEFKGGPYLRLRHELWKNVFDLEDSTRDDRSFYRIKASLWGQADFSKTVSLFAKLTNESRSYVYFENGDSGYSISEAVIDNLYLDVKDFLGYPLDLRLGRQDILPPVYGEGFLFGDGTPLDGSRTFYFNAARASWRFGPDNTMDVLYIRDYKNENLLPAINEPAVKSSLNASDETAYGLYFKSDPAKTVHWENYYIFKNEDTALETDLSTIGSFVKYGPGAWALRGQLAYQFGTFGDEDRTGLGGYLYYDRNFKQAPLSPAVTVGGAYLSGDDPATSKVEAWDPLFSRYPLISELYGLTYAGESGLYYWTNLTMYRGALTFVPAQKSKVTLACSLLNANTDTLTGGTGKERGKLLQAKFDYSFTKNITAYVLGEHFTPGDYHATTADPALFVRTELQLKY